MSTDLDDDEIQVREEDKTRQIQLSALDRPRIDDLGRSPETQSSALPEPRVAPFTTPLAPPPAPAPRAAPPAVAADKGAGSPPPPPGGKPPPPPLPNAARKEPVVEDPNAPPTIIVKPITHEPTARRLQREATVVVKRMVGPTVRRTSRRSPVAVAVLVAVVLIGGALAFTAILRWRENRQREQQIEERFQQLQRGQ